MIYQKMPTHYVERQSQNGKLAYVLLLGGRVYPESPEHEKKPKTIVLAQRSS